MAAKKSAEKCVARSELLCFLFLLYLNWCLPKLFSFSFPSSSSSSSRLLELASSLINHAKQFFISDDLIENTRRKLFPQLPIETVSAEN